MCFSCNFDMCARCASSIRRLRQLAIQRGAAMCWRGHDVTPAPAGTACSRCHLTSNPVNDCTCQTPLCEACNPPQRSHQAAPASPAAATAVAATPPLQLLAAPATALAACPRGHPLMSLRRSFTTCAHCARRCSNALILNCSLCTYDLCNVCAVNLAPASSETPSASSTALCTFARTGRVYTEQDVYMCNTCNLNWRPSGINLVICAVCAFSCHRGHSLEFKHRSNAFCDCGLHGPPCARRGNQIEASKPPTSMQPLPVSPITARSDVHHHYPSTTPLTNSRDPLPSQYANTMPPSAARAPGESAEFHSSDATVGPGDAWRRASAPLSASSAAGSVSAAQSNASLANREGMATSDYSSEFDDFGGSGAADGYDSLARAADQLGQHQQERERSDREKKATAAAASARAVSQSLSDLLLGSASLSSSLLSPSSSGSLNSGNSPRSSRGMSALVDASQLTILRDEQLGSGCFGAVFKGLWNSAPVAVKLTRPDSAQRSEWEKEALALTNIPAHPYCVTFFGLSPQEDGQIALVMELMEHGSLHSFVRASVSLTVHDKLSLLRQAAAGLSHLHRNDFIHRDVAARNFLVGPRGNSHVVKITDFGLSRQTETEAYYSSSHVFPVLWTAPEGLAKERFSRASDVWSFGVLIWEVLNHGEPPRYPVGHAGLLLHLLNGGRLARPNVCSDALWTLVNDCWHLDPTARVVTDVLLRRLGDLEADSAAGPPVPELSGYTSSPYYKSETEPPTIVTPPVSGADVPTAAPSSPVVPSAAAPVAVAVAPYSLSLSESSSVADVCKWLEARALSKHVPIVESNEIDGEALGLLGTDGLTKLGIPMGTAVKLLASVSGRTSSPALVK